MKKGWIIFLLVLIVAAVFIAKPDLLGGGDGDSPLLSVGVVDDTMLIPSEIPCDNAKDCTDFALLQDPDAVDVKATCDVTCTFIAEKTLTEVAE